MTEQNNGGPAFPGPTFSQSGMPSGHSMGMTLRDWYRGQIIGHVMCEWAESRPDEGETWYQMCARVTNEQVDAMLAARATE